MIWCVNPISSLLHFGELIIQAPKKEITVVWWPVNVFIITFGKHFPQIRVVHGLQLKRRRGDDRRIF